MLGHYWLFICCLRVGAGRGGEQTIAVEGTSCCSSSQVVGTFTLVCEVGCEMQQWSRASSCQKSLLARQLDERT